MQGIHHGHWARQGPFDLLVGQGAQELCVLYEHWRLALYGTDHAGHAGLIAVTDQHRLLVLKVHAGQVLNEGGDKVLAGLLTIGNDVDTALGLFQHCCTRGVLLAIA